jgi:hypothetical protein
MRRQEEASCAMINGRRQKTAWHREAVGRNLTLAREALGSSRNDWIEQYGDSYGVYASKLSMWEAGITYPDLFFLIGLCEEHGLTLDWFLRGERSGLASSLVSALPAAAAETRVRLKA